MSITDLAKKYGRGKTTIWHHVHTIKLSQDKESILRARKGTSRKRSKDEWIRAEHEAQGILRDFSLAHANTWAILFIALYWAEGTKSSFVFTNTDPDMIRIFLRFLKKFLHVADERIDILVRTSIPMKPSECQKYWASITGFPLKYVRINHNDQHNKSKTTYGMCRITVRQGGYLLKLFHCLKKELVASM